MILHAVDIEREMYESYMDLHEIACQPFNPDEVSYGMIDNCTIHFI